MTDFREFTRNFFIAGLISLVFVTILSVLIHEYVDSFPVLKVGKPILLIFVSVLLSVIYLFSLDKKLDKQEIFTIILISALLAGSYYAIYSTIPEIFSVFPDITKQTIFSAFGG